jgi:uncharacterized protein (TIGR02996 family)
VERVLLEAIHRDPADDLAWQALADWLEEQGDGRAELVRLVRRLRVLPLRVGARRRRDNERSRVEARVQALLQAGARPVVPEVVNSIGMRLVLIPAGTALMGSAADAPDVSEGPQHEVEIAQRFYLGAFPVTQEQWLAVLGTNPSHFQATAGPRNAARGMDTLRFPVERVSWHDAFHFCRALSARPEEKAAGRAYRLPSEAEWEHACRAGTTTDFHFGTSASSAQANFDGRASYGGAVRGMFLERTSRVGSYPPNGWGLYDMHGNVFEWCSDWYDPGYYSVSPRAGPTGPQEGTNRVIRGGCWCSPGVGCRSAAREPQGPWVTSPTVGFRVVMVPAEG